MAFSTTAIVENGPRGRLAASRNYYVSTSGDDGNTGLSSLAPFLTIQAAFDAIAVLDLLDPFNLTINLAAGTYTEGAKFAIGLQSRNRVTIKGPTVTRDTPTAIIDGTSAVLTYGLWFEGPSSIYLKDVLIQDFAAADEVGVLSTAYNDLFCENVWIDNCDFGLSSRQHTILRVKHGKISGCGDTGILGLDFPLMTIGYQGSTVPDGTPPFATTDGTWLFDNAIGINGAENAQGHVDYCRIDGNGAGIGIAQEYGSRLNIIGTSFLNLAVGRTNRFGSWHVNNTGTDTTVTVPEIFDLTSGDADTPPSALPRTTTAALAAVGNAINTSGKYAGKAVINTTAGTIVTANGAAAADVWLALAGTTAHTPI